MEFTPTLEASPAFNSLRIMTMQARIQELFAKAAQVSAVVGAQLSIIKDGRQLDFVHGLANAELGLPMMQDTVIQIGSATKVFNAVMIMSLVEESKLALDTPVRKYIPQFQLADAKAAGSITLRQLLSMSAGIDNGDYAEYGSGEDAVARRVTALKTLPQHFPPGTHFGYSNAGTDITGYAAERVTGKVWDQLLKERVIEPLGLRNVVSLDRDRMYQRVSVGHVVNAKTGSVSVVRPWGLSRGLAPAGGTLTASAHDLARLGKLFLDNGIADSGRRVLSEDSIKAMMTPVVEVPVHYQATSWCVGPCKMDWNGAQIWGHRGGNISGASFLYILPESNVAMAWIVNTPSVLGRFEKVVVQEIMEVVCGVSKPEIKPPTVAVDIDPERYCGVYTSLGGQLQVEAMTGCLRLKRTTKDFSNEAVEIVEDLALIPLGNDRFMIDRGAQTDPLGLADDIAFFGADCQGRATNATNFVFPYSRRT